MPQNISTDKTMIMCRIKQGKLGRTISIHTGLPYSIR